MNISKLLLALAALSLTSSCDLLGLKKDKEDPSVKIYQPEEGETFTAGDTIKLLISVKDNEEISQVEIYDGFSLTQIASFDDPTWHDVTMEVIIPESTTEGPVTITVTVEDAAGNSVEDSRTINILEKPSGPSSTVFNVTTPSSTPADAQIEIVGTFNNWPNELDANYILTKISENSYSITMQIEEGAKFKFRRDGSWAKVEVDATYQDIDDRVFNSTDGSIQSFTVLNWIDL